MVPPIQRVFIHSIRHSPDQIRIPPSPASIEKRELSKTATMSSRSRGTSPSRFHSLRDASSRIRPHSSSRASAYFSGIISKSARYTARAIDSRVVQSKNTWGQKDSFGMAIQPTPSYDFATISAHSEFTIFSSSRRQTSSDTPHFSTHGLSRSSKQTNIRSTLRKSSDKSDFSLNQITIIVHRINPHCACIEYIDPTGLLFVLSPSLVLAAEREHVRGILEYSVRPN